MKVDPVFTIVVYDDGVACVTDGEGRFWCGPNGWVHPDSSYFQLTPNCFAVEFSSPRKALEFAEEYT